MAIAKNTMPVRIPMESYEKVKEYAERGNRSISRQLAAIVAAGLKAEESKQ